MKKNYVVSPFLKGILFFALVLISETVFSQAPTISSFSPVSGSIGTPVVINGTNFSSTAGNNVVYFGATKAAVTGATATSLTVTVPSGATHKYITVTTNNLTASSRLLFTPTFFACGGSLIDPAAWLSPVVFTLPASSNTLSGTCIADIDGDGKADLLVFHWNSGIAKDSIFVFRNTSSVGTINAGSFAPAVGFPTGVNGDKIIVGDLDGDGKLDLVTTSNSFGAAFNFCILRNTSSVGSLSFAAPQIINFVNAGYVYNIAIGDLDGDGKPDLALANSNLLVKRNTSTVGSISFAAEAIISTGGSTNIVVMGDIDGDGKTDLVTDGSGSSDLAILRNTSSIGSITMSAGTNFTNPFSSNPTRISDLDGDGKLDVVTTSGMVFRNTSSVGVINASSFATAVKVTGGAATLHVADIDGDSKPDLLSGTAALKNACSPGIITTSSFTNSASISSNDVGAIGDLDGDGLPDIAYSSNNTVKVVKSKPVAMTVNVTQLTPACGGGPTGSAFAGATNATGALTYTWTTAPVQNGSTATNLSAITYSVTITDANNCTATGSITITQPPTPTTPDICMVTVDSLSIYNEVYWDKAMYPGLDSMVIYREVTSNVFKRIGAVSKNALSMYIDTARSIGPANGNPNIGTYRYKIQLRDTCGNYSAKSLWHNTVFFINSSGTFFWNEYKIEINTNPMTQFDLVRDDFAPTGNYNTVGSVAGTQTTLNDPFYVAYQNTADWRVYAYGLNCVPTMRLNNGTQGTIVKSRSNVKTNRVNGINTFGLNAVKVYPNPAANEITIQLSKDCNNCSLEITNALGQTIKSEKLSSLDNKINIASLASGVYYVKVKSDVNAQLIQKIVVQR